MVSFEMRNFTYLFLFCNVINFKNKEIYSFIIKLAHGYILSIFL